VASQSDFSISSDYENTLPPFTDDVDSSTLETSIQPTHADNTTYRIRGIPLKCKKGELENLLRGVLRLDGTRGAVKFRSMVFSPDRKTKMAAADFTNPPTGLSSDRNEWSFEILDAYNSDA